MKKVLAFVAASVLSASLMAGCSTTANTAGTSDGSSSNTTSTDSSTTTNTETTDYSEIDVNASTQTVSIYCEVNGTYFTENTRHGIVYSGGTNGEKAILRGLCSEKDFYQALINIGATPGDNVQFPMVAGEYVEGDKFDVTVSWDGSDGEIPFADCVKTGDGDPYVMDATFGGNIKNAYKANTGCILCLDSCAVGIVSSAAYPSGTIEMTGSEQFFGNSDVLPADGTVVKVTFTLISE